MAKVEPRQAGTGVFLAFWGIGLSFVVAGLMSPHWIPKVRPSVQDSEWISRVSGERGNWLAVHVLYDGCPCSIRVLNHLRDRGPVPDVVERIVLIGDSSSSMDVKMDGFGVVRMTSEQLKDCYGVESVPMLLVFNPDGSAVYAGGHTPRKQSDDFRDRWIILELINGGVVEELPVYGCTVPE